MTEPEPIVITEDQLSLPPPDLFQAIQQQQLEAMDSEHWHDLIEKSPGVKWKTRTTHGGGCPICGTGYCVRAGGEVEIGSEKWREFSRAIGWTEEEIAGWCAPALLKDLDRAHEQIAELQERITVVVMLSENTGHKEATIRTGLVNHALAPNLYEKPRGWDEELADAEKYRGHDDVAEMLWREDNDRG